MKVYTISTNLPVKFWPGIKVVLDIFPYNSPNDCFIFRIFAKPDMSPEERRYDLIASILIDVTRVSRYNNQTMSVRLSVLTTEPIGLFSLRIM